MKTPSKKSSVCILYVAAAVLILTGCSRREMFSSTDRPTQSKSLSEHYNHFSGGLLFTDMNEGLKVLWAASFVNGRAYKENLGYFVTGGLLISPNRDNTYKGASTNALTKLLRDGKLYVIHQGIELEVLAIIHTHPSFQSLRMPTPSADYQFGHMGIHNYIIGHDDLFDAYKDASGYEVYERLGGRTEFGKIPFLKR
jgi:hypothetical protein